MFDAIKSLGSGFVLGLKNPDNAECPDDIPGCVGVLIGGATRGVCFVAIGSAALLGVLWEARWIHGVLKIHYKPTDKWYDYAEWCKFLEDEK